MNCPNCNNKLVNDKHPPKNNDVGMCSNCGEFLIYADDNLLIMTMEQLDGLKKRDWRRWCYLMDEKGVFNTYKKFSVLIQEFEEKFAALCEKKVYAKCKKSIAVS